MSDVVETILDAMNTEVASELTDFTELAYKIEIERNSYRQNDSRYGIIPGQVSQLAGTNQYVQVEQTFEVVLTKSFARADINDEQQLGKAIDLYENMYSVYKRLVTTKAGAPQYVALITGLDIQNPQYLNEEKVVVLRSTLRINYRFSLV
jgi:hypothetical protein